jgi:hypothetical protein
MKVYVCYENLWEGNSEPQRIFKSKESAEAWAEEHNGCWGDNEIKEMEVEE